jgi:hypothetical protein
VDTGFQRLGGGETSDLGKPEQDERVRIAGLQIDHPLFRVFGNADLDRAALSAAQDDVDAPHSNDSFCGRASAALAYRRSSCSSWLQAAGVGADERFGRKPRGLNGSDYRICRLGHFINRAFGGGWQFR